MKIVNWLLLIPFAALAYAARMQLWASFDAEGLPLPLSLSSLAMPLLLAVAAVVFFLLARKLPAKRELCAGMERYFSFNIAALLCAVGGSFLYLLELLFTLLGGVEMGELLSDALLAVGAMCLIATFAALRKGKKFAGVLLLVPVCALLLRVILFFRAHTPDPFLRDYYVELLALAAVTAFLLEFAAFAFGSGAPRRFVPLGEISVLLCVASVAGTQLGGVFTANDLCFYGGSFLLALGFLGAVDFEP